MLVLLHRSSFRSMLGNEAETGFVEDFGEGRCHGNGLRNPIWDCLPKFDTAISVWRRILFPGFNTVILHHGIASGSTGIITSSTRILRPSRAIHSEPISGIISPS